MIRAIIAALALGFAVPALADKGDTNKDVQDKAADTVDNAKDALHTDSGKDKAKRHVDRSGRDVKRKVWHTKNDVKREHAAKKGLPAQSPRPRRQEGAAGGLLRSGRPAAFWRHGKEAAGRRRGH